MSVLPVNISREFENILQAIEESAESILEEDKISPAVREYTLSIRESGSLLLSLVNNISGLRDIENGNISTEPVEYELATVLAGCLEDTYPILSSGVELLTAIDGTLPSVLLGHPYLRQIVLNLLAYAATNTSKGFIRLEVGGNIENEFLNLDLAISYTGRAVEATKQIASMNSAELGLLFAGEYAHLMGGTLSTKNEPGRSSKIALHLPQQIKDRSPMGTEFLEGGDDRTRLIDFTAPTARVLVIDDQESNLRIARGLLSPYELTVDTALSGQEALTLAQNNDYDIIFIDRILPLMDGSEIAATLRAAGVSKPVLVALTTDPVPGIRKMIKAEGMDEYLAKPIRPDKLNEVLGYWLPAGRLRR